MNKQVEVDFKWLLVGAALTSAVWGAFFVGMMHGA